VSIHEIVDGLVTGMVYPAFGVVYGDPNISFRFHLLMICVWIGKGIQTFSYPDPHQRRVEGDRNALW
jgi:hypothetical protein